MEGRIKLRLILIGALSIILTAVSITFAFQSAFRNQSINDIKLNTGLIEHSYNSTVYEGDITDSEVLKALLDSGEDLRVTLIAPSGEVLFDSEAVQELDNHLNRPEIAKAFENGEGDAVRRSPTFGYEMYYYAVKLDNGNVLRCSREVGDMFGAFKTVLPIILIIAAVIMLIAICVSVFLTRKLVRSITHMAQNLDEVDEGDVFEEMRPFIINMKEQQEKKNQIEKMKQDFTANVSHELKTPLTSISGYAEMIETGMAKEEDIKAFAGKIHHESGRLIRLIGDIIKLSEINELSTLGNKDYEEVDLYEIVEGTVNALKFNASKADISFELSVGNGVDSENSNDSEVDGKFIVTGNKGMLEELVYNICDNAVRYNKPGGRIFVSLYRDGGLSDSADSSGTVVLSIKDTGIGIPEKYYDRIFERFYRVDKSRSKETGGTGLGLAIVKHIAIQHKAVLTVESRENVGTEIKVEFG